MTSQSRAGRGRAIATVAVASALSLLVVELLLRWLAPMHLVGIQRAYRYDADLGYRLREDIHLFQVSDHLEEVRVNALGTVNFQESFEDYAELVFALGDSYTMGTGLPADASYPIQLDLELNLDGTGRYRPRYAVVNLGLAAFGGEQSLAALRAGASRLGTPGHVLYLGCDNDDEDDRLFLGGYRHRHVVHGSPVWRSAVPFLLRLGELEVVKRAKVVVSRIRRARTLTTVPVEDAGAASVAEKSWPVIRRIRAACEESGSVLVLSWANPESPSYEWLKRKAAEEGVAFADWWPDARSVRQAIPGLPVENPHSAKHYRPWVNRIVASAFAREIRRARLGG